MYAPENKCRIITRETPGELTILKKSTLTAKPNLSRPILHKMVFEEQHTVAGRVYRVQKIRKFELNLKNEVHQFAQTYFKTNYNQIIS